MEVFAVTIFVSLMFAVLFVAVFLAERLQMQRGSLEQVALLPLDDGAGPPTVNFNGTRSHDQHIRHESAY